MVISVYDDMQKYHFAQYGKGMKKGLSQLDGYRRWESKKKFASLEYPGLRHFHFECLIAIGTKFYPGIIT